MVGDEQRQTDLHVVLTNDEGQYSLWPGRKEVPRGWSRTGKEGSKAECLKYVDEVWLDITPLSVRKNVAGLQDLQDR